MYYLMRPYHVLTHHDVAFSISAVEALVGYRLENWSLLWEAITNGNRRLALVGNAVLFAHGPLH